MTTCKNWSAVCQNPRDDSGDLIVELPPELLGRRGRGLGIEKENECFSLKLKQHTGDEGGSRQSLLGLLRSRYSVISMP